MLFLTVRLQVLLRFPFPASAPHRLFCYLLTRRISRCKHPLRWWYENISTTSTEPPQGGFPGYSCRHRVIPTAKAAPGTIYRYQRRRASCRCRAVLAFPPVLGFLLITALVPPPSI